MSDSALHLHLDAYLSVREALGFQMRAERTLLRDFVHFSRPALPLAPSVPSAPWTGPVPRQPGGGRAEPPNA
jgi:hypothetical protein